MFKLSYFFMGRDFMRYLGKLFLSLKEIFITMILQYVILILCVLIIGVNKSVIWGSVLLMIFETLYVIWKIRNCNFDIERIRKTLNSESYFPYVLIGVGVSAVYNMTIFKLGLGQDVTTDFPIILNVLCSGIVGPIFEEVLFRYDLIRRLERFNSKRFSIIFIAGVIFGLMHTGITTIIYALVVGIINSYIYIKDKDIVKPIMVHMAGNIFVNLLYGYNTWIFIFGIILILLGVLIIRDND